MIYKGVINIMTEKERIGYLKLVETIGREYCLQHKDTACFCAQELEKGLYCFLGIDLHADERELCLSASMSDWDIYATCYVLDNNDVVLDECRLPEQE